MKCIVGVFLVFVLAGCGGNNSSTGPSPTAPTSTPTNPGPRWIVNSDSSSAHVGRFEAADGTVLDFWRGSEDRRISDLRLRQPSGGTIYFRTDASNRPTYFEDPTGTKLWVNEYVGDAKADVTVAVRDGETRRAIIDLPVGAAAARPSHGLATGLLAASTADELSTVNTGFCDPKVLSGVRVVLIGICAVSVVAAILSSGVGVGLAIIGCAQTALLIPVLESQMCSYVSSAALAATDSANVTTALLSESASPVPPPPNVEPTPPPSNITFTFSGAREGVQCTGTYTFDPSVADSNPDPQIGVYEMPAPFRFEVSFGGSVVFSTTSGLTIEVTNNLDGSDWYDVEPVQPSGSDLHLNLRTPDTSFFASDALPTMPPWGGGWWGVFEGDHAGRLYICDLNSLTRSSR